MFNIQVQLFKFSIRLHVIDVRYDYGRDLGTTTMEVAMKNDGK